MNSRIDDECVYLGWEWDTGRLKAELKQPGLSHFSFALQHFSHLVPQTFHLSGLPGLEHFLPLPISASWKLLPLLFIKRVAGTESKKQKAKQDSWLGPAQNFYSQEVLSSQGFLHIQLTALS